MGEAAPTATAAGAVLAAQSAARAHDYAAASLFIDRGLAGGSDDADLLRRAVTYAVAAGRFERAAEIAARAPAGFSALAQTLVGLRRLQAGLVAAADAEATFATLPRQGAGSVAVPLLRAWTAAARDDMAAVDLHLSGLGDDRGLQPLRRFTRALILDVGAKPEAADAWRQLLTATPNAPFALVTLGANALARAGDREAATALVRDFVTRNPDSELAEVLRADDPVTPKPIVASVADGVAQALYDVASLVQNERGGAELGLLYARLALMMRPEFPLARLLVGEIQEAQRNQAAAIETYGALAGQPGWGWLARMRIAGARDQSGDTETALSELAQMGVDAPTRYDALWRRADILRAREKFNDAAEAYAQAIGRVSTPDRRHWALYFGRGIAFERTKRWELAEADMKRSLELLPDQPYVLNYLGYTWLEQNINLTEAKRMIERAVAQRPRDGAIIDSLGWAYYRTGDFVTATSHLERAVEFKPGDATINDHLGDAYWQVGRRLEARFQWQRALGLDPDADLKATIMRKLAQGDNPEVAPSPGKPN
jgi:tetratricopeptide (TPR) repeat protein